jgi:uncharacterized membrane protein YhhN
VDTDAGRGFVLLAPAVGCALAVALLLRAERRGSRRGVALWKPLAAAGFLSAAWLWGAPDSAYGRLILLGLALCACGDVLLIPRGTGPWLALGILAFLAGHVAYAAAFFSLPQSGAALGAAAAAIALLVWRVDVWLAPHLPPGFRWPVRSYFVAIGAMGALALGAVGAGAPLSAGAGALGFMASDLSVAQVRFVAPGFRHTAWGLPLYFGSQLLLAWSSAAAGP